MSASLSSLDPRFRPYAEALVSAARGLGKTVVTSARRSWSDQARLYMDYLQGRRALPALPPDRSLHVAGLAVDLVCGNYTVGGPPSPEMAELGRAWIAFGGRWGGAADPVHYSA